MSAEANVTSAMGLVRVNAKGYPNPALLPAIAVRTEKAEPTNRELMIEIRAVQAGILALAQSLDQKK
jgi:hypothetical protein